MTRRVLFAPLILALFAAGCSDDSEGTSDGGPPVDGHVDDMISGTSLTVHVVESIDEDDVEGAHVAVDLRGDRFEGETNLSGNATFDGLDFAGETAAVTVFADGYGIVTRFGVEEDEGTLDVRIVDLDPSTATLSGAVANPTDPANPLIVSSTAGRTVHSGSGAEDYMVEVMRGTEGTIVAFEYTSSIPAGPRDLDLDVLGWATKDHAAISLNTVVDIDFVADAATPIAVTSTLVPPSRTASPLHTDSVGTVIAGSGLSNTFLGVYETSTFDGTDFTVLSEHVDLGTDVEPRSTYAIRVGSGNLVEEQSTVTLEGYPQDGATIDTFLDTPEFVTPSISPLHDEVEWTLHDASDMNILRLFRPETDGPVRIWDVFVAGDATSVTIPELPSEADDFVLGTYPLEARIAVCDLDEDLDICTRFAQSKPIELVVP